MPGLLETIQAEMESHMQKEEQVLFPMMLRGGHPMITHPIGMMRHEHDEHGRNLEAMREITRNLTAPADACGSWRRLYAGLAKLADDLNTHIRIENDILFPRFGA
jgi:regulator of cell morphogenesis and NO signaling